jgi:hypothetical protein
MLDYSSIRGLTSVSGNEAYLEVTLGEAYLIKEKHRREEDQREGWGIVMETMADT